MPLALSILGATGKMGKCVLSLALKDPEWAVVGIAAHQKSSFAGRSLEGIAVSSSAQEVLLSSEVAIDFSVREAVSAHVLAARVAKKPLVIGTTGLLSEDLSCIESAAQDIPIVVSSNFSLGIALCLDLAATLGPILSAKSRIDIFETHHVHKKDKPSGTALALADAIGKGKEEIAIHSIRSGEIVGEHSLVFECGFERLEIKHTAHSREAFAQGALVAAKHLVGKPPGLYTLKSLCTLTN